MPCSICGASRVSRRAVLWEELISAWQLSPEEVAYINEQQGTTCDGCGSNLRSQALALAIQASLDSTRVLCQLVQDPGLKHQSVLEINEAGDLSRHLRKLPGYRFGAYPEVDLHDLPFDDASFDLIVHSDTLEHVQRPVRALAECLRVLRPGGSLCFTVPIVVGRLSRRREGLPASYHGSPSLSGEDYRVHTEYGADVWTDVLRAGFQRVELLTVDYPAALAILARKQQP